MSDSLSELLRRPIERRRLRTILDEALRTDADLEAFCLDFFPEVHRRFATGMNRLQKVNLLLELVNPEAIASHLPEQSAAQLRSAAPDGSRFSRGLRLGLTFIGLSLLFLIVWKALQTLNSAQSGQLLSNAFQTLTIISVSPFALLTYAITAVAYIIIAIRVSRHRHLLERLASLPEHDRLKAIQVEFNEPALRYGLTPEQWLRGRIHRYYLFAFLATCLTIIVIISLIIKHLDGGLDIDVTGYQSRLFHNNQKTHRFELIHNANAAEFTFSDPNDTAAGGFSNIRYEYQKIGDSPNKGLLIRPVGFLLSAIRKGEMTEGFGFTGQPFRWNFPALSVKIANNTRQTVLLSEAQVEVIRSEVDLRPVIVIYSPTYSNLFTFQNEGWGEVVQPVADVTIMDSNCAEALTQNTQIKLNSFSDKRTLDLSTIINNGIRKKFLQCADDIKEICSFHGCFNVEGLKCSEHYDGMRSCSPANRRAGDKKIRDLFGNISKKRIEDFVKFMRSCDEEQPMCVVGQLAYRGQDHHEYIHKFKTRVYIGQKPILEPVAQTPRPPTYQYDMFLQSGSSGSTIRRAISQSIQPGEVDHFLINIATDKSSNFALKVRLITADGKTAWSGNVDIEIIVPRSGAERALRKLDLK